MIKGIDISGNQATTPDLRDLGFVVVKASEGTGWHDPKYKTHAANVRRAGLPLGAYHFGRYGDGAKQARNLLAAAPDADFYALDDETDMTSAQADAFIAEFHRQKRRVGYYASLSHSWRHGQDWNWVAAWDGISPGKGWTFHQYRGAPLDLDLFAGDPAALRRFVASQGGIMPSPVTPGTPQAEPSLYTGGLISVLLAVAEQLAGPGIIVPNDPKQSLINVMGLAAPFIASIIIRPFVTPNAKVPAVPAEQPPAETTPDDALYIAPSVTVSPFAVPIHVTVPAGTRRFAATEPYGELPMLTIQHGGPCDAEVYIDNGDHTPHGTFWRTTTTPAYLVPKSAVVVGATAVIKTPPSTPITDTTGLFIGEISDAIYMRGGSPDNPNGITFSFADAVRWWKHVFANPVDLSAVRPTLQPGSIVLTPAGNAAARSFSAAGNGNPKAPEDYNPLALPIVP